MLRRVLHRGEPLRDERGIALVMAVGIMFVLSIALVSALDFSGANSRNTNVSKERESAFSIAEAGFNNAASKLLSAPDPSLTSALPAGSATYGDDRVEWSGTLTPGTPPVWTITAKSYVKNPTGASDLTHTVSGQVEVSTVVTLNGNEAWNFVYSDNTTSCLVLQNSFEVEAPLYVQGNLCLENTAEIKGDEVDVRGTVQTKGDQASIGSAANPVDRVFVKGGCRNISGGGGPQPSFQLPCIPLHRVWSGTFNSNPPALTKPPNNVPAMYSGANIGPLTPCADPPAAFDIDTTQLNPGSREVNLLPNDRNYNCQVGSAYLRWTRGSPGTLQVNGTIFFDANLVVQNNTQLVYTGKGAIYGSGTVEIENLSRICSVAGCASSWNPNVNMLTLVAGSANVPAWSLGNNSRFQGGAYAVGGFEVDNSGEMTGPVVADAIEATNSAVFHAWTPFTSPPVGVPLNGGYPTAKYRAGSWRG